jgi:hypothetical protein
MKLGEGREMKGTKQTFPQNGFRQTSIPSPNQQG